MSWTSLDECLYNQLVKFKTYNKQELHDCFGLGLEGDMTAWGGENRSNLI